MSHIGGGEKSRKSLLERLKEYSESDFYPFHMPGHKRAARAWMESSFPSPWSIDITEIDGFDDLHHPKGILKEAMKEAVGVYGSDRTYYLVNGSSSGILASVCAAADFGGKLLLARNCHKSAYHAMILQRLRPVYVYPKMIEPLGINGDIRAEDIRSILAEDTAAFGQQKICAVLIVSPTYEGIVSDIEKIANAVHEYKIPLIVDEAHGAHLPFAPKDGAFPRPALECGADLVIQSVHKTLPSLTQTAVLHLRGNLVDRERLERYLGIFQSSSPSYVLMAGIEQCIRYMDGAGREEMRRYEARMDHFYRETKRLRALEVLDAGHFKEHSVFAWDMSKIVISTGKIPGLDGGRLGRLLRERFHLETELCAPRYVIAMTSLMDTEAGFSRLSEALFWLDGELSAEGEKMGAEDAAASVQDIPCAIPHAAGVLTAAEALERAGREIPFSFSAGNVSKEFIYLYPPGIPLLVPGEEITKEVISLVNSYREAGFSVEGMKDRTLSSILTVAESEKDVIE